MPPEVHAKISLRTSVISLVAAANVAVFAAGLAWVADTAARQRAQVETAYGELLRAPLQSLLDARGRVYAAGLLRWSHWDVFDDVIIAHLPDIGADPDVRTRGIQLNPVGSGHRSPSFDEAGVMGDIRRAASELREVSTTRGLSLPVYLPTGELWGGCWVRTRWAAGTRGLVVSLLPWFLVSTLVLTLLTFTSMRHLVLDPVRDLAHAVGRIAHGDFTVRVAERARSEELSELLSGFNAMAQQVEDYNAHLEEQVAVATAQARDAEAAAMTQRRLAATGELAAGIAHEINNPLGGMLNAVEVLERDDVPRERRRRYHKLLKSGLERIGRTVGRVLRLAPREARVEAVQLAVPLSDALGLVRHRASRQGVRIVLRSGGRERELDAPDAFELFADLPPIRGETNELGQAFLNLLVNALDALEARNRQRREGGRGAQENGERGRIEVTLERRGAELYLRFADDGPGMRPGVLERAADLFFTTKDTGRGTGLGLAIVHNVIAAHGGRVLLKSESGAGVAVELVLPIDREATETGGASR